VTGLRDAVRSKGVTLPPRHVPKQQLWMVLAAHPADPTGIVAGWAPEIAEAAQVRQAAQEERAAAVAAKAAAKAATQQAIEQTWKERAAREAGAAGEVAVKSEGTAGAETATGATAGTKPNNVVQQRMDEYQRLARRWCVLSARPNPGQRRSVCTPHAGEGGWGRQARLVGCGGATRGATLADGEAEAGGVRGAAVPQRGASCSVGALLPAA
jgi:hypothetical protein